jgi:hypothetical protein
MPQKPWPWPTFAALLILQLWLAHAIAFFAHEYAHSTTAWLLGWKANPLALTYGHLNAGNLLAMFDIDENVNYIPIFATSHRIHAGIIAAAGLVLGNGLITYPLSLWSYATAKRRGSRIATMFSYWLIVASVGNFIDYVPIRTFSASGDIHTAAQGFACSPWGILLVIGIPSAIALVHLFARIEPQALRSIAPTSPAQRAILAVITAAALFGFYGLAGLSNGSISHQMSLISLALFPIMATLGAWQTTRTTL